MAHKFLVGTASALAGKLTYSDSDRGFAFHSRSPDDLAERVGESGRTSLVADTLQLEVAVDSGSALYVWGYLPMNSWQRADLKLPASTCGSVIVVVDDPPLEEHVSVSIARSNWITVFDERIGLVRVTRDQCISEKLVEIAGGVYLGLNGTELNSFWLQPDFVA